MHDDGAQPSTHPCLSVVETAEELILTYMTQQNRPFAATDVHLNLKGAVTKTAAQKALLALADKGKLLKKEYGGI
jgi:26S proteasome regulatory subunit, ATPase 3, interacting protein